MFTKKSLLTITAANLILGLCAGAASSQTRPCEPDLYLDSTSMSQSSVSGTMASTADLVFTAQTPGVLVIESSGGALRLDDGACGLGATRQVIEHTGHQLVMAFSKPGNYGFRLHRTSRRPGNARAQFIEATVSHQTLDLTTTQADTVWVHETSLHAVENQTTIHTWPEGPPGAGRHLVSFFEITQGPGLDQTAESRDATMLTMVARTQQRLGSTNAWLDTNLRFRALTDLRPSKDFPEVDPDPDHFAAGCEAPNKDFPEVDPDPDHLTAGCDAPNKDFPEVDPDPDHFTAGCDTPNKDFPEVDPDPDHFTAGCGTPNKDFPEVDPDPDHLTAGCDTPNKDFPEVDPDPDHFTAGCDTPNKDFPEVDPDPDHLTAGCERRLKDFPEVDPDPDHFAAGCASKLRHLEARLMREAREETSTRASIEWVLQILHPELGLADTEDSTGHRLLSLR